MKAKKCASGGSCKLRKMFGSSKDKGMKGAPMSVGSSAPMPERLDKHKRGGAVKKKGDTKITIINAPMAKDKAMPVPVPIQGGLPGGAPPRPPMPPMPSQPIPVRKCGGRTR